MFEVLRCSSMFSSVNSNMAISLIYFPEILRARLRAGAAICSK